MEKVIVFVDYANVSAAARELGMEIDFGALLAYLANPAEGRFLQEAFAYVPIDPRQDHAMDRKIQELWDEGFIVKSKVGTIAGRSYKCDFDVEMTLDMARAAFDMSPDIAVLVSGDSDFVPVVLELRGKGIRVEAASFGNSMAEQLRRKCSGYINLDVLIDGEEPDWGDEPEVLGTEWSENGQSADAGFETPADQGSESGDLHETAQENLAAEIIAEWEVDDTRAAESELDGEVSRSRFQLPTA